MSIRTSIASQAAGRLLAAGIALVSVPALAEQLPWGRSEPIPVISPGGSPPGAPPPAPSRLGAGERTTQVNEGYGGQRGYDGQPYNPQTRGETFSPSRPPYAQPYPPPGSSYPAPTDQGYPRAVEQGYGRPSDQPYGSRQYGQQPYGSQPYGSQPYGAPSYGSQPYGRSYDAGPPPGPYADPPPGAYSREHRAPTGSYSMGEITEAGRSFFGSISQGLASVIEYAFQRSGRPNGYILGEDAGGAFFAGLRYGEGIMFTKDAGQHKVYWQGPSLGFDMGAEGSKVMILVYNLSSPHDIYATFGGLNGAAYLIGGVGVTFQTHNEVILAPIRSGLGLRLGANVGYLKYTRHPTWNPF